MNEFPMFWVILAAVIIIVFLVRRFGGSATIKKAGLGVDVEGDLLRVCRGDRAMVNRLIQHELDRKPDLSRTGATLMALSRLRDDNH